MRHAMLLVPTLFAIAMLSGVHLTMAADHARQRATGQKPQQEQAGQQMRSALAQSAAALAGDPDVVGQHTHHLGDFTPAVTGDFDAQLSTRMGVSSWRQAEGPAPFLLLPEPPAGQSGGGVEDLSLIEDELGVADDRNVAPRALERDWRDLGRDTAFFLGYQGLAAGVWFLTSESVSKWTPEQRKTSLQQWWENVRHPQWDPDTWYVNYLGHPYFGAIAYIRARERRFGAFGGFWYATLISGLYAFGIEALFERSSYQDLIVTPVGGALLGAFL